LLRLRLRPGTIASARSRANSSESTSTSAGVRVVAQQDVRLNVINHVTASDSDGDGVDNAGDKCPTTAAGIQVDEVGCTILEVVDMSGIKFHLASSQLKPESETTLVKLARYLIVNDSLKVEIAGYTDSLGDERFNSWLSTRRAENVRDYLILQDVPAHRMSYFGYGSAYPIASNATEEGREENRRVVARILSR